MVYITVKDRREARKIGKKLVKSRLAACVNIIEGMNSLYFWEGKLRDDEEVILIAKTRASLVSELIEEVRAMHSYRCPSIVSLPIEDGNDEFLDWIAEETG